MRQGSKSLAVGVATALWALAMMPLVAPQAMQAGAAGKSTAAGTTKSSGAQRQFTGFVTALDKNTITVEKRGKKPQSRTFARHAELQTDGDLAKEARVTVYYRDEGGQSIAQRVIVKTAATTPKSDR
jgi:hypothetical protein